jgi:hypothetical protein
MDMVLLQLLPIFVTTSVTLPRHPARKNKCAVRDVVLQTIGKVTSKKEGTNWIYLYDL